NMRRGLAVLAVLGVATTSAWDEKKKGEGASAVATTAAAPAPSPSGGAAGTATGAAAGDAGKGGTDTPAPRGENRHPLLAGKGSFLIDAPLEKIKGSSDEVRGHVDVNPKDLTKTTGEILVRLSTLRTATFDDADKNVAQTEHARNWMEVGNDATASTRMKYE